MWIFFCFVGDCQAPLPWQFSTLVELYYIQLFEIFVKTILNVVEMVKNIVIIVNYIIKIILSHI